MPDQSAFFDNSTILTRNNISEDNKFLLAPSNPTLITGDIDFTITCWVLFTQKSRTMTLVAKWPKHPTSDRDKEFILQYSKGYDKFMFKVVNDLNSGFVKSNIGGGTLQDVWNYVVFWHDSVNNEIGLQINDNDPDIRSYSDGIQITNTPLTLGARTGGADPHLGLLDKIGMWKRVLTSTERTSLFNSLSGKSFGDLSVDEKKNLAFYHDFDSKTDSKFSDSFGSNDLIDQNGVGLSTNIPPTA